MPKKRKRPDASLAPEKLLGNDHAHSPETGKKAMAERIMFLENEIEGCLKAREQFGMSRANETYLAECKHDLNSARRRLAQYKAKSFKN